MVVRHKTSARESKDNERYKTYSGYVTMLAPAAVRKRLVNVREMHAFDVSPMTVAGLMLPGGLNCHVFCPLIASAP